MVRTKYNITTHQISIAFIVVMALAILGIVSGMILLYAGYFQTGLIAAMISTLIGWITIFIVLSMYHWGGD
jgi:hypothetical protein